MVQAIGYLIRGISVEGLPRRLDGQVIDLQEMWDRSLGREDPLEEEMATHSSIFA